MSEFTDWYVWCVSHPEGAKWLLSHFHHDFVPVDIGLAEPRLHAISLRLSGLPYSPDMAAAWIGAKLTREMCGQILHELGFATEDLEAWEGPEIPRAGMGSLKLYPRSRNYKKGFSGRDRWEAAVQWALERWEDAKQADKATERGGQK